MGRVSGRTLNRLNHTRIVKLKTAGIYEDGGALRLVVGPNLTKRWVLRVAINGNRRERGLCSFPTVPLDAARTRARDFRTAAHEGRDRSIEIKTAKQSGERTFEVAIDEFFAVRRQTLPNAKHITQWQSTMKTYAYVTSQPCDDAARRQLDTRADRPSAFAVTSPTPT